MEEFLAKEEVEDLLEFHQEVIPSIPFKDFCEMFFESVDWQGFLELLSEASYTDTTSKYGLAATKKLPSVLFLKPPTV